MSIFLLIFIFMIIIFDNFVSSQNTDLFFPNLVQFYTVVPCGGVLISPDWVLTAAQCLANKRNVKVMGSNEILSVKATFIHPEFDMYSKVRDHRHNVALMKLHRPFNDFFNKSGGILVNIGADKSIKSYDCCFIYGWDSFISSAVRVLTKAVQTISVLPRNKEACVDKTNDLRIVCASGESRRHCAGNPGSPIVCRESNGGFRVLGIASWTNFSLQCDNSSTYLNLTSFRSWIVNLISMASETNTRPNNYSSTTRMKVQVEYYSNTRKLPENYYFHDPTTSTTIELTTGHRDYQDIERSDKNEETTEDELSKIFPLYDESSSSNLVYPIYFIIILAKICVRVL